MAPLVSLRRYDDTWKKFRPELQLVEEESAAAGERALSQSHGQEQEARTERESRPETEENRRDQKPESHLSLPQADVSH